MPALISSGLDVTVTLTPQVANLTGPLSATASLQPEQELSTANLSLAFWANANASSSPSSAVVEYQTAILAHVFMAVYVLFAALIAVFNALTIVAIAKCPELKTATNKFVLSLSCADLILSPTLVLIHFVPQALAMIGIPLTRVLATCLFSLMFTSSGTSLFSILAIAIDRYVAVLHPYNYKQVMTPRRVTLSIVLIWAYVTTFMTSLVGYYMFSVHPVVFLHLSFIFVIIPRPVYVGAILSQILVCIVASVALYVKISLAIRRRHLASAALRGRTSLTEVKQSRRVTTTMALVLGALVISWTPYTVVSATISAAFMVRHQWVVYVNMFSILLLYANSFMNPVIYAARIQAFRRAYWKTVCCACLNAPSSPEYVTVETPSFKSTNNRESVAEAILQNGKSDLDTTEI